MTREQAPATTQIDSHSLWPNRVAQQHENHRHREMNSQAGSVVSKPHDMQTTKEQKNLGDLIQPKAKRPTLGPRKRK
ncbi:predicted protein [Lichtheimia corymbifera JMRC:FSU:9682]|uniref:Uncharacterized protein n=1 Tax=Lichtheimia corymbifera JMRC:FSU:9682 TaxID=1263082 RepID=A0A068SES2_9FUNG|nr:predicted protein [Lichtheimia corymbifera JMRC:FSU:9682]